MTTFTALFVCYIAVVFVSKATAFAPGSAVALDPPTPTIQKTKEAQVVGSSLSPQRTCPFAFLHGSPSQCIASTTIQSGNQYHPTSLDLLLTKIKVALVKPLIRLNFWRLERQKTGKVAKRHLGPSHDPALIERGYIRQFGQRKRKGLSDAEMRQAVSRRGAQAFFLGAFSVLLTSDNPADIRLVDHWYKSMGGPNCGTDTNIARLLGRWFDLSTFWKVFTTMGAVLDVFESSNHYIAKGLFMSPKGAAILARSHQNMKIDEDIFMASIHLMIHSFAEVFGEEDGKIVRSLIDVDLMKKAIVGSGTVAQ